MKKSWFANVNNFRSEKKVLFSTILIFAILILVLLMGESYMRIISPDGYITPEVLKSKVEDTNLIYSPSLFSRHVFPQKEHFVKYSISDSFRFELEDGFEDKVKWYINEKGYRGSNFSVVKPKGMIRIIVYGGSFVYDIRTGKGQDWPHLLGDMLQKEGYPVEIINAGIPGHMSFDSFGRFYTEGHHYDPDYVIICNKWNDFKYFRSDIPPLRYFMPMGSSSDPRYQYTGSLDRILCNISQLYAHLRNQYYELKFEEKPQPMVPDQEYTSEINETALKQYQLHFQLFVDAAKNLGITPILMTQPVLIAENNTEKQKQIIENEKVKLTHEGLFHASERADEILRQIARSKDVFLIDASKSLSGNGDLFTDQVHLTRNGAHELAKFMSIEVKKILKK